MITGSKKVGFLQYLKMVPILIFLLIISTTLVGSASQTSPIILWSNPDNITYGTALSVTQLNAVSESGTFVYTPPAGTILGFGQHTLFVYFTPSDTGNYTSNYSSVTINVSKANPTISWTPDVTYGMSLPNPQGSATATANGQNVPGTFTCDQTGTKLSVGTHDVTVIFIPTDTNNYNSPVTQQVTISVKKMTPTITWSNPYDISSGTPLSNTTQNAIAQLNAIATNPDGTSVSGKFVYTPTEGTVLSVGTHTLHADFTPDDNVNYSSASKDVTINVTNCPVAKFDAAPSSGIAPMKVQFTDLSTSPTADPVTDWIWNFRDGSDLNYSQNPVHVFKYPGTYNVSLTAKNSFGTSYASTFYSTIHVYPVPVASFEYYPSSGEAPLKVHFKDTSKGAKTYDGNIISWNWNFGDNTNSNDQNPIHTYTVPGTYYVTLKITVNSFGTSNPESTSTVTSVVNVYPKSLAAKFSTSQDIGLVPLTVEFTDCSTGDPNTWHWDFGDGTNSNSQNPRHTYYRAGAYTVTLTVTNNQGSTSSRTALIYVNPYPVGYFTTDLTSGTAPLTVHFTDTSTGSPIYWTWDFGDGNISHYQNPFHTYYEPGTYEVSLAIKDAFGNSIPKGSSIINVYSLPEADFYSNISSGVAPLTVQFTDNSTGNPAAWYWDFGDGTNSNHRNPMHRYTAPGTYKVTLTVTNSVGTSTTGGDKNTGDVNPAWKGPSLITVNASESSPASVAFPSVDFYSDVTAGTAPFTVQFHDNSTSFTPTAWSWNFGDGTTSNEQNPLHTYSASGSYTITMSAGNNSLWGNITKVAYITVGTGSSDSSSGGSSSIGTATIVSADSSSGGRSSGIGVGGSSEPLSNIQSKATDENFIIAGNHVTYDFTRGTTPIDFLEFDTNRTFGKITTVIEQLKGRSSLTSIDPEGKVIQYVNIWVGNGGIVNENNIKNGNIEFRVRKDEVTKDEESTVTLQRYADGKWNSLNTTKTGDDTQYIYYQAKTPGFSPFVITKKTESELNNSQVNSISQTTIQPLEMKNSEESGLNNNKESGLNSSTDSGNKGLSGITTIIIVFIGILIIIMIGLIVREKTKSK